ncbi:histidinol dehydrogenase [Iamia sp. SCSIO 61187]|uniref:histidinol dehydrogenase n=1 Tax=Iamia sp. SCSIO 61187 TaxID=2722752 RepID=UPI001C636D63|nr:histidinol dehydrogenase [Iamia sp. SCSIO 61187]QYG93360.1 histidinol dehydrogenase [Iamia sp. SCSIO 61187]
MLARLDLRGLDPASLAAALPPLTLDDDGPRLAVRQVLDAVRAGGDAAVRELTARFDGIDVATTRVPDEVIAAAVDAVDPEVRAALEAAAAGIEDFHRHQLRPPTTYRRDGIVIEGRAQPVDRAGCYVPGGRALYPSTVLMTAVPALVAGVPEVALCVPPGPDGEVPTLTLAAAAVAGVTEVHRIGGAQAIAALAYGTETVRPVDVVVGPGNVYVAEAKRQVAGEGRVGVPSAFAGPSEVIVIADGSAPAALAAVDVILQAEHGPGGRAWFVTWDEEAADAVLAEIAEQVAASPRRADIESTFASGGYLALVDGPEAAAEVANHVAPEHLEVICDAAASATVVGRIRHAGAVFVGPWSPASVGDYVAGPSHVLPTAGTARFGSALTVADFTKDIHVVTLDRDALAAVAPHVAVLAEAEGLPAHADSVRRRLAPTEAAT